jgi:amidase
MTRHIRKEELQEFARRALFSLPEDQVEAFHAMTEEMFEGFDRFERLPDPPNEWVPANRDAGRRPAGDEDPCNAVVRWCSVKATDPAAAAGPLAGVRVGLKDMFAIGGLPLTFGSHVLRAYVADEDSAIARNLLEAGAEIVAVTNMEAFAFSAGGETSAYGPVLNPFDLTRTACGSSNGSAAALAYESIDLTFGTDSGGSVRIPASWCGVIGLKATHGLVPYTGTISADWRFDHAGPMARTVEQLAAGLDAVIEERTIDPVAKAIHVHEPGTYLDAVGAAPERLDGVKLGVLKEGFAAAEDPEAPEGTRESAAAVKAAIERLRELGAEVREVSVPEHLDGPDIMFTALVETTSSALHGAPSAYGWWSKASGHFAAGLGAGMKAYGDELPDTFKLIAILGTYMREEYFGSFGARAHAMADGLRDAYDAALAEVDMLVLPTTTHYAHQLMPELPLEERVMRGWTMLGNASPFNISGHPAISIPAAEADGLPVGVQLVAPRFEDRRLIETARAYERAYGWLPSGGPSLPGGARP